MARAVGALVIAVLLLLTSCALPGSSPPVVFEMTYGPDGAPCDSIPLTDPVYARGDESGRVELWAKCCAKAGGRLIGARAGPAWETQGLGAKVYAAPLCAVGGFP